MWQVEIPGLKDGGVYDFFSARQHSFPYGLVVQIEVDDAYVPFFCGIRNLLRIEVGNSICTSKPEYAVVVGKRGVFAEFISLQAIVCIEIAERVGIQIKTWHSGIGAYP